MSKLREIQEITVCESSAQMLTTAAFSELPAASGDGRGRNTAPMDIPGRPATTSMRGEDQGMPDDDVVRAPKILAHLHRGLGPIVLRGPSTDGGERERRGTMAQSGMGGS
jgi:hypothetical protein